MAQSTTVLEIEASSLPISCTIFPPAILLYIEQILLLPESFNFDVQGFNKLVKKNRTACYIEKISIFKTKIGSWSREKKFYSCFHTRLNFYDFQRQKYPCFTSCC